MAGTQWRRAHSQDLSGSATQAVVQARRFSPEGQGGTQGWIAAFGRASHLGACLLHHTPSLSPGFCSWKRKPVELSHEEGSSWEGP